MGYYHCYLCSLLPLLLAFSWSVDACQFPNVGYEVEDLRSEERLSRLFESWRDRHGKSYQNISEEEARRQIFRANLEYIDSHNRNRGSSTRAGHWLGLNKFADLTNEEFKILYSAKIKKNPWISSDEQRPRVHDSCEADACVDWRRKGAVTPVQDQGSCRSDWAFSATGAIEGINKISTGVLQSLSVQELIDCSYDNFGCKGGNMDFAFKWVIEDGGIQTNSNYPYISSAINWCKRNGKAATIDSYNYVEANESALLCAVAKQPVSVGISGTAIDFQFYMGGVYAGDCSNNPEDIDHAMLIVGYSSEDEEDYWIVKNSWGAEWGLKGYIYIRRNTVLKYGVCAINAMAVYPTKRESPAVRPPPGRSVVDRKPYSYCPLGQTCCCEFDVFGVCLLYSCCDLPTPTPQPPIPISPPPPIPIDPPPAVAIVPLPIDLVPPPTPEGPLSAGRQNSYCSSEQTCCCCDKAHISDSYIATFCCCNFTKAVCCENSVYCCPLDYPICNSTAGNGLICVKNVGDTQGVRKVKRKPISAGTHSSTNVTQAHPGHRDHDLGEL